MNKTDSGTSFQNQKIAHRKEREYKLNIPAILIDMEYLQKVVSYINRHHKEQSESHTELY